MIFVTESYVIIINIIELLDNNFGDLRFSR